jgi:hypothetical protein
MTRLGARRSALRRTSSALIAIVALAGATIAQQPQPPDLPRRQFPPGGFGRAREPVDLNAAEDLPYDGHFTFARLRYSMDLGSSLGEGMFGRRRGGWREPPWSHDYPRAERNFMKILKEVTAIDPYTGPAGGRILDLGDPELFKYPIAYMSEPGYWTQTDEEAANLRAYLQKGGFLIFDDFRGRDWTTFEAQLARVLPDGRLVELDVSSPIFQSFFGIESLNMVQFYDRGTPIFYGVFEENDPKKRLLLVANYNNDIGEYWEFSDTGWTPIDLSNEAYKFGVNYIVYGMTH